MFPRHPAQKLVPSMPARRDSVTAVQCLAADAARYVRQGVTSLSAAIRCTSSRSGTSVWPHAVSCRCHRGACVPSFGDAQSAAGEYRLVDVFVALGHVIDAKGHLDAFAAPRPGSTLPARCNPSTSPSRSSAMRNRVTPSGTASGHGPASEGDHRRAGRHGLDHDHPEQLVPFDWEQQAPGLGQ